jgi:hypothetical protein
VGCAVATLRTASSSQLRRYSPAVAKTRMKAPRSVVDVPRKNVPSPHRADLFASFFFPKLQLALIVASHPYGPDVRSCDCGARGG